MKYVPKLIYGLLLVIALLVAKFIVGILLLLEGIPFIFLLSLISIFVLILFHLIFMKIKYKYNWKEKKEKKEESFKMPSYPKNPIDPNTLFRINGFNVRNGE